MSIVTRTRTKPCRYPRLGLFAGGQVTFRWRDSAYNNEQKLMTLSLEAVSCAASYCISFRKASCASGTSASWPTGGVPLSFRFAFTISAQPMSRKPNNTFPPPKTRRIFGTAPTVVAR